MIHKVITYFVFALMLTSCSFTQSDKEMKEASAMETKQSLIKYATAFDLIQEEGDFLLHILNPDDGSVLQVWNLSERPMQGINDIQIPVNNLVCGSTTQLYYLNLLQELDCVSGVTYLDRMLDDSLKSSLVAQKTVNVLSGSGLNKELVVTLEPELILVSPFDKEIYKGFEVFYFQEYLESHPLGRLEWIKVLGALTGKYQKSQEIFNKIAKRYNAIKLEPSAQNKVMLGNYFQDQWFVAGGNSFIAHLVGDAGGTYVSSEIDGVDNKALDQEAMLYKISQVNSFGFMGGFTPDDQFFMNKIHLSQEEYDKLSWFYVNTTESDYFGKAVVQPDVLLSDLIAIFNQSSESTTYFKSIHQ